MVELGFVEYIDILIIQTNLTVCCIVLSRGWISWFTTNSYMYRFKAMNH